MHTQNAGNSLSEGDVPQDKITCLFFVKEGIRKLNDLNTVIINNTIYFNRWRLFARTNSVEQELEPQKIGKRRLRPCPKGQVTVFEHTVTPKDTVGILHREPVAPTGSIRLTRARVLRHEKRCATVASLS